MIKINLLPPHLRVHKKKKAVKKVVENGAPRAPAQGLQALPWKNIGIGAGALFLLVTFFLDFDYLRQKNKIKTTDAEWQAIQPQLQALRLLESEVNKTLIPERDFLNTHALNKAPVTLLLQAMSQDLPDGVWLTGFSLNNSGKSRSFGLQGIAVNIEGKTHIEQIEEYLQKLKAVIPNSKFNYSTTKQVVDRVVATAFNADYNWQAD